MAEAALAMIGQLTDRGLLLPPDWHGSEALVCATHVPARSVSEVH